MNADYHRVCIVGAGASGLAAAKNLLEMGIDCEVFESHSGIGGIWDIEHPESTLYESTHTITSKEMTGYTDMPVPNDYPVYMHHRLVLRYLRSYAAKFDLARVIHFNHRVERCEPRPGGGWDITVQGPAGTRTASRKRLILANGHNWQPNSPSYPGDFSGECLHSKSYKTPDRFTGKRVLVVGSGNTGCDLAVEIGRVASSTYLSARRGYHYLPKFIMGRPTDVLGKGTQRLRVPIAIIRFFFRLLVWVTMGRQTDYGLPKPDHKLLETPPIANSLLPYAVAHGDVKVKADIERLEGHTIHFVDGTQEDVDVIIYATGFRPHFPFIDRTHLAWKDNNPRPYLFLFHPERDDLYFAGLTDGTGGHFPTVDHGCRLIARYIAALERCPEAAAPLQELKKGPPAELTSGIELVETPRNYTQFELHYYLQLLQRYCTKLDRALAKVAHRPPRVLVEAGEVGRS